MTVKFGLGVEFDPLKMDQNPNSSLNLYKLMCNILSLLLTWYLQVSNQLPVLNAFVVYLLIAKFCPSDITRLMIT